MGSYNFIISTIINQTLVFSGPLMLTELHVIQGFQFTNCVNLFSDILGLQFTCKSKLENINPDFPLANIYRKLFSKLLLCICLFFFTCVAYHLAERPAMSVPLYHWQW